MTLKELPESTELSKVKVKLSEQLYKNSSLPSYKIKTREVYLVGCMMGDFFVKTDITKSQIYPMFKDSIPWEELKDLEVVEEV